MMRLAACPIDESTRLAEHHCQVRTRRMLSRSALDNRKTDTIFNQRPGLITRRRERPADARMILEKV